MYCKAQILVNVKTSKKEKEIKISTIKKQGKEN